MTVRKAFALQNINPIYVQHHRPVTQKYSQEYLAQFNLNPNFEADALRLQKEQAEKTFKDAIVNSKFNDKLVENRLGKIKIRTSDPLQEY